MNIERAFIGFIVGILAVLALFNIFVGYEFSDTGFTQSVAYRILQEGAVY